MNNIIEFKNFNLQNLKSLAQKIAPCLKVGDVIALHGDLGAGKTTFSSFLINAILPKPSIITSPTFNLVHVYPFKNTNIWHFDLYRLKEKEEVIYLGINEAFKEGISIIEWPEIINDILPLNTIYIELSHCKEDLRNITIRNIKFDLE